MTSNDFESFYNDFGRLPLDVLRFWINDTRLWQIPVIFDDLIMLKTLTLDVFAAQIDQMKTKYRYAKSVQMRCVCARRQIYAYSQTFMCVCV